MTARFPCTLSKLSGEQEKVKNERSINNLIQIRTAGLEALKNALGVVGAVRFMQQYDTGYGDYTKEKYAFAYEDACRELMELKGSGIWEGNLDEDTGV
ncbi:MAG: hypothetical protein IJR93_07375 [Treponema sp.]|nr:hypothetical protein [Treponema sp.]